MLWSGTQSRWSAPCSLKCTGRVGVGWDSCFHSQSYCLMNKLWYGAIKRHCNKRIVLPLQLSFFHTSTQAVNAPWVGALIGASMRLIPGLVLRPPLTWLRGGETDTQGPSLPRVASGLLPSLLLHQLLIQAPGCVLPPLRLLNTAGHLHLGPWRSRPLAECWQAPAVPKLQSWVLCPSSPLP